MGRRPRIKRGELTRFLNVEERKRKVYGEIISIVMKENNCSWQEAKKIHRFEQLERNIKREMALIDKS